MAYEKFALVSVTDKTGIVAFTRQLASCGYGILSTGGTAALLKNEGIDVVSVADFTGQPELMDGRVKTLHPKIHGGILWDRDDARHSEDAEKAGIQPIDFVVVNLYEFEKHALQNALSTSDAIHFIDIGGPTMLRAAAKNHRHVAPVMDPSDYDGIIAELRADSSGTQGLSLKTRVRLAQKTFENISRYDGMIAKFFAEAEASRTTSISGPARESFSEAFHQGLQLRYGENPHQQASFATYKDAPSGLQDAKVIQGKPLSYNNYLDIDAAANLVFDLSDKRAVAIIKHTNPCGVAWSSVESVDKIFKHALACDDKSAFGGIIASNQIIDVEAARCMSEIFVECIAAPGFSDEALDIFSFKKNLRLLSLPFLEAASQSSTKPPSGQSKATKQIRSVRGGVLIQDLDQTVATSESLKVVSKNSSLSPSLSEDLVFAQIVAKHVKSNAIVLAKSGRTLGIGAGQMSRIDACELAVKKSEEAHLDLSGAVLASDAFFPFRDTVDFASKHGIKAIIQPGGSMRDDESIKACEEHGILMAFTGIRHFKH